MNWLSKWLSDSVCARILAAYILMLIGGIVGWWLFTYLSQPFAAGRMDSAQMLDCLYHCLILPFVTILIGPLVIGVAIGMLLIGPGSGMLGLLLLLALSGLQYALLVVAFRRILRSKRWMWGIYLFVYSALLAYVFPIVTYLT